MDTKEKPAHPLFDMLRVEVEEVHNLRWLARQTGYSHAYVRGVACGFFNPSAAFRAKAAIAMGLPEGELFLPDCAERVRTHDRQPLTVGER